jgi:hypothetical protein
MAEVEKKKWGWGKRILVGFAGLLGLLFVIGLLAPAPQTNGTSAAVASTEGGSALPRLAPVKVTARELARAYEENEAAAQQRFGEHPLEVTGLITGITLDFADDPVVQLATDNQFMAAQAMLSDDSKAIAPTLKKGQTIVILCAGVGEVIGAPMLRDCAIQP